MFDITQIKALAGLVGINQPTNPAYAILNAANIASDSGLFVDDISKYYKVEYLKETQDYSDLDSDGFNALLVRDQENTIIRVMKDVFDQPDVIESKPLFSDSPDEWDEEDNNGDFVGYELKLQQKSNLALTINKVWSYFNAGGTIKLLLLNQYKNAIIDSKEITVTANTITETLLNWHIPLSNSIMAGRYYIGYLTGGLTPKALNGSRCQNNFNSVCIRDVIVKGWNTETIFNYDDIDGAGKDFGLNFDISVVRDNTASILNNKLLFARAIALRMAIDAIKSYRASLRSNIKQRYTKELDNALIFEIEGNPDVKIYGLKHDYLNEIKKLKKGFTPVGNKMNIAQVT